MSKLKPRYILLLIIIFGLGLRFYDIYHTIVWRGDTARDFLVGYLIAVYQEKPILGHYNSGINFYYPPYYFYFIGFLTKITTHVPYLVSFFTLLHALIIIPIFVSTRYLLGEKKALLSAFFFAVSTTFIEISHTVLSAYSSMLITISAFSLIVVGIKNGKKILVIIGTLLAFASITVFYGNIILIPFMWLFLIAKFKTEKVFLAILSGGSIVFFFLLNVPIIKFFGFRSFIYQHFPYNYSNAVDTIFMSNFLNLITGLGKYLFGTFYLYALILIGILTIYTLVFSRGKKLYYLLLLSLFPLFLGSFHNHFLLHFFILSAPFVISLLAFLIHEVITKKRVIGLLLIIGFSILLTKNSFLKYNNEYDPFYYHTSKKIFENMDEQVNDYDESILFQPMAYPNTWEGFSLQYFWQIRKNNQLFILKPTPYTTALKNASPHKTVIVCNDLILEDVTVSDQECQKFSQSLAKKTKTELLKLSELINLTPD